MPRILISAGEASGDAYGAALVEALRERRPDLTIEGLGGPKMRNAGVRLHADSSKW
ncbi:lipid-A-disaccharide synthase, partial [bacterium]